MDSAELDTFAVDVVREGLAAIASTSAAQLKVNREFGEHIDEIYDPIVLDYLRGLVGAGRVTADLAAEIEGLYTEIERSSAGLTWQEEDLRIERNASSVRRWREMASYLLRDFEGQVHAG